MYALRQVKMRLLVASLAVLLGAGEQTAATAHDFEVWLVDQSNSPGQTYGGTIYIYDDADLKRKHLLDAVPTAAIKLADATAKLCLEKTGANPVRPHMLLFNMAHSHALLAFVTSGHVVIFDATTRAPVACLRMSLGAGDTRQAHAAFPPPDDTYILVANQNGKLLERLDVDYTTNTYTLNPAATLNLATCTTPNGVACQVADVRPDTAPICPIIDASGRLGFVTLRGGGIVAWVLPFPHEIRFGSFVTQQLSVSLRKGPLLQAFPDVGDS